jgi:RNA polymerase sigma-70 factor (ECF subfamily)
MTGNSWEAEDLTQEIFIQLLRKVGSFRGESQFTTWLYRLATNQVLMHLRSVGRQRESANLSDDLTDIQGVKHSFGRQMTDRITIDTALRKLPCGYRSVFLKYDVEGYNHREIAGLFGCTVGTSKSQLHKARRRLRKLLKAKRNQSLRTPINRIGSIP